MAYTEKVSLNGTALSFLLYECTNCTNSQEGFLIGDVTSEITNHISDSQSDNARLDTQIVIRTVLPMPSVSLFYLPTGRIKEDVLREVLSNCASEIVGWYKYRKNSNIKPTFRDKLISKGLQKYFEKHHGKKTFVTCNLSSNVSTASSTHTFSYRFGKINCLDMYEYIEDVTANLGEKPTGYKKPLRLSPHSIFNKIVRESNITNSNDAILRIQEAVDVRLLKEAKIAAKNESTIKHLETEIKQMQSILADKQVEELQVAYNKMIEKEAIDKEIEMSKACVEALNAPDDQQQELLQNTNHSSESQSTACVIEFEDEFKNRSPSPILMSDTASSTPKPMLNYAAALRNKTAKPSTSRISFTEDLISFDGEENHVKINNCRKEDLKCVGDSSPEY